MIDMSFLSVKFTEITLLHILILLGIPYILLYFFHKKTEFDNFPEKWELALFVFVIGGIIVLTSLFLIEFGIPFWFSYILFILILSFALIILGLKHEDKQHETKEKWISLKLKNGQRFEGIISKFNPYFIQIKRGKREKLTEIDRNNNERVLDWENIQFNTSEILGIYST